jgi:hypothetical protein
LSIPDPGSRISNPGSRISDLGSRISEPGSRIPDPKIATKEKGGKKIYVLPFFCSHKYHKIKSYFIFEQLKKKLWDNLQTIIEFFLPEKMSSSSNPQK